MMAELQVRERGRGGVWRVVTALPLTRMTTKSTYAFPGFRAKNGFLQQSPSRFVESMYNDMTAEAQT